MSPITDEQAQALAALVATLHPGWDIPGIRSALHSARHRASAHDLAVAAIRCTQGTARKPNVIAMDGPHWREPKRDSVPDHRFDRCQIPGHTSYPAWNCGACKTDGLDPSEPGTPPETDFYAQTAASGAAAAREAIRKARQEGRGEPDGPDPATGTSHPDPGRHRRTSHLAPEVREPALTGGER